jgi:hypothetical protein
MKPSGSACAGLRPLGTPIACSITMKRPGSRRTPPTRLRVGFQLLLDAGGDLEVLRQEDVHHLRRGRRRTSVAALISRVRYRS